MIAEKVDYPFLHEEMIKGYRKTLIDLGRGPFAAMMCDQDGSKDRETYYATKYAVEQIDKELADLKERYKALIAELTAKYGKKGEDWIMTMDGSVHRIVKESSNEQVDSQ